MIDYDNFDEIFQSFCDIRGDSHACDCRGCEFEYSISCNDIKNNDYMAKIVKDYEEFQKEIFGE